LEQELIKSIASRVADELMKKNFSAPKHHLIPAGVSNRHVHLSEEHARKLFGSNLTKMRDLSQTGQFAAEETVILAGPRGSIERVRVLGPARQQTQVEISVSDAYKLGVEVHIRESGDIKGTAGITIIGSNGSVQLDEGVIVAKRHIHMSPEDAALLQVQDGDIVQVRTEGERALIFDQVTVRVNEKFNLEFHIDFEEANAAGLKQGDYVSIAGRMPGAARPEGKRNPLPSSSNEGINGLDLVTEEAARKASGQLYLNPGAIITPLAKDLIKDRGIKVIYLK
jgi:putative phosphotransacetylase